MNSSLSKQKWLQTLAKPCATAAAVSALLLMSTGADARIETVNKNPRIEFDMQVSKGAAHCLPEAEAEVTVIQNNNAEDLYLYASGLPANTDFDLFVIQVPNAPFGLSWYQADVHSDKWGNAFQHVRGIFSFETFAIAPGVAPAPQTFTSPPFPDAKQNPETVGPDGKTPGPVQMYHLGLWFDSPEDAKAAGCPGAVTPFNGKHNAGIQVLNTAQFTKEGPLAELKVD